MPTNPPSTLKLPVIVFGETGCFPSGIVFKNWLTEVASHGIFIIANGTPGGAAENPNGIWETSHPNGTLHQQAIDWVHKVAGTGKYTNVVPERLAAAGQSCGGMQAYTQAHDPRVKALGIFNSGAKETNNTMASMFDKPVFYFLGGPNDIAWANVSQISVRRLISTTLTPRV
jgi:dienelactone hydrolase